MEIINERKTRREWFTDSHRKKTYLGESDQLRQVLSSKMKCENLILN